MGVGWVFRGIIEMRDEIDTGASRKEKRLAIVIDILPIEIPILDPDEVMFIPRWRYGNKPHVASKEVHVRHRC